MHSYNSQNTNSATDLSTQAVQAVHKHKHMGYILDGISLDGMSLILI